jgi:hypothetical protein
MSVQCPLLTPFHNQSNSYDKGIAFIFENSVFGSHVDYPALAEIVLKSLRRLATTYDCELDFSYVSVYLSPTVALYLYNFQHVSADLSSRHQGLNHCRQ